MKFSQEMIYLAALQWGVINAVKKQWPKLGGLYVWGLAFFFGYFLAFLTAIDVYDVRAWMLTGFLYSASALGVDGALYRLIQARRESLRPNITAEPEHGTPIPPAPSLPRD